MGIVGDKPESGIRIVLERPRDGGPPWIYTGNAFTPEEGFPITATVEADGAVNVTLDPKAPAELEEKIRLMVRTVYKQGKTDGDLAPARSIVRWRGEK